MNKKIAIYTGYFLPHLGGVERYVDKLSLELTQQGYECSIVTTRHDESLPIEEVIDGRKIYRLPTYGLFKQRYPIIKKNQEYKTLIEKLKQEQAGAVIVNTRFHLTSLAGARLAKRLGQKVYLIEHGTAHFSVGNKLLDFFGLLYEHVLTVRMKRLVGRYYGVSEKCNQWLRHFGITADGVWYNAIDSADTTAASDAFDNAFPERVTVISYAGRLIKEKGVGNLLDAFRSIKDNYPEGSLKLVIAGDGPLLDEIRQQADDTIVLPGRLDFADVMSLYKRTDIFVYPSLYPEGLPTSILEAGLMSCAVVATPRGGTEEVIMDDDHGTIIDGTPQSIAEALKVFIDNAKHREQCGQNIKRRIETEFSWSATARRVVSELEKESE